MSNIENYSTPTQKIMASEKHNIDTILDQTFFGLDTLSMLGDVEDFIKFSEGNIGWQKQRELRCAEQECNNIKFDDPQSEFQYRDQLTEGVKYRFDVSLKQRVHYAALIALITTIEWALLILKKRTSFNFTAVPKRMNEAVHVMSVFNEKMDLSLEPKILQLEALIQIRNCIVHSAGLLASYKYEKELRQTLMGLQGVKVTDLNFLGESIEIETGFLEEIIKDVSLWLPNIERTAAARKLLR